MTPKINGKTWLSMVLTTVVFLYIFAETNLLHNKNLIYNKDPLWRLLLASLSLTLVLWAFPSRCKYKLIGYLFLTTKVFLILGVLFCIFAEAAIADFSGILFGPEAIVHMSWDAFILGVKEYLWLFTGFLVFLLLITYGLVYSCHKTLTTSFQLMLFSASLFILWLTFSSTVIGRYYSGIQEYRHLNKLQDSSKAEMDALKAFGVSPLNVQKNEIQAQLGNQKNLIVIYLESFSDVFTTSKKFPNLTPNINQLKEEYVALNPYVSTSLFTMDGLIGSNCGFLPNMALGNNSLIGSEKQYFLIPCMSDVLKKVGYYQEFWGGAKKSFAGKGEFLIDHGYNKVYGWEDYENFEEINFSKNRSWWGLHDNDLFDHAFESIENLSKKDTPFHLSLLTLSSHLKGFPAPTCKPYKENSHKYIDSIHCTDQLLGQFINQLKQANLLENTVVFITGDHSVFRNSLTEDLFGPEIHDANILGVLIDHKAHSNHIPMALYDMAPVLLDRLAIKHNVNFINGQSNEFSKDRIILTRGQAFLEGKPISLNKNCDPEGALNPIKMDFCTHQNIISTLHGYSQLFKMNKGLKFNADSRLEVVLNEDRSSVLEISLKGKNIKDFFSRDGFKLSEKHFSSHDVFFIQFDSGSKTIRKAILLNISNNEKSIAYHLGQEKDFPYIMFGVDNNRTAAFLSKLKEKTDMQCLNKHLCTYRINELGYVKSNTTQNKVTLNFTQ